MFLYHLAAESGEANLGVPLPMTVFTPVPLPAFLLEHDDLVGAAVLDDFAFHRLAFDQRYPHDGAVAVGPQQNFAKGDLVADLGVHLGDAKNGIRGGLELLAVDFQDRVHDCSTSGSVASTAPGSRTQPRICTRLRKKCQGSLWLAAHDDATAAAAVNGS